MLRYTPLRTSTQLESGIKVNKYYTLAVPFPVQELRHQDEHEILTS